MDERQGGPKRCAECGSDIFEGHDVLRVEEGVVGLRGFVTLDDEEFFCNERCLRRHFDEDASSVGQLPRRIP